MKRTQAIALAALLALGLGVWAAMVGFRGRARPADPDVVTRAMEAIPAPVDSAEIKSRWQEEVRGVDLAGLDGAQRELFVRFANAGSCTCGCGYTLAGCKASDMSCEVSGERLHALLDSIRAGHIRDAAGIRARPAPDG